MRIISRKTLKEFWTGHPDAESPLCAWFAEATKANWESPADVKALYAAASILRDGRAVFNIGGNKYRLIVWINYTYQIIYIRWVGSHADYDKIDAQTI